MNSLLMLIFLIGFGCAMISCKDQKSNTPVEEEEGIEKGEDGRYILSSESDDNESDDNESDDN